MSSTVEMTTNLADPNLSLEEDPSKQQPLTVREKIVNLFQELETNRDEHRRINAALEKEIQGRLEVKKDETKNNNVFFSLLSSRLKTKRRIFDDKFSSSK